jgi:hypothetical protein
MFCVCFLVYIVNNTMYMSYKAIGFLKVTRDNYFIFVLILPRYYREFHMQTIFFSSEGLVRITNHTHHKWWTRILNTNTYIIHRRHIQRTHSYPLHTNTASLWRIQDSLCFGRCMLGFHSWLPHSLKVADWPYECEVT